MSREIQKGAFEQMFPEINTYGLDMYSPVFLEDGTILTCQDWNGEEYIVDGRSYRPLQVPADWDEDGEPSEWETVDYEVH